jgi:hypothetical protein
MNTTLPLDPFEVEAIMREAVRRALIEHMNAGNSVPTWEDGKIRMLSPDDIRAVVEKLSAENNSQKSE